MVIYNWLGVGMLLAAAAVAAALMVVAMLLMPGVMQNPAGNLTLLGNLIMRIPVLLVCVGLDIPYRLARSNRRWWLVNPRSGGHLMFMPIWLVGIWFGLSLLFGK